MSGTNGDLVREDVLRDARREIRELAGQGRSMGEIDRALNGHRLLTEVEKNIVHLLTRHAVAEARGHY